MKLIAFGAGEYYKRYSSKIAENDEIVAILDNNAEAQSRLVDGIRVYSPDELNSIEYDLIVLFSAKWSGMKEQLIACGVSDNRIHSWKEYYGSINSGKIEYFSEYSVTENSVIVITDILQYNGGAMAALNLCDALNELGYSPLLVAAEASAAFVEEMRNQYSIAICPSIACPGDSETEWVSKFNKVFVNTFIMMRTALAIADKREIIWWIHEPDYMYQDIIKQNEKLISDDAFRKMKVYAVSRIASNNYRRNLGREAEGILELGVKDYVANGRDGNKRYVAIIGPVTKLKSQDTFVRAAKQLIDAGRIEKGTEFVLIGKIEDNAYYQTFSNVIGDYDEILMLGEKNREELRELFGSIEMVVCASKEETMSMTIIEGMLNGKKCITTSNTGVADYIATVAGDVIFEYGDYETLAKCIEEQQQSDGNEFRKCYEEVFSMEQFIKRISGIVK